MNRAQRRFSKKFYSKQLKKAAFDDFQEVPEFKERVKHSSLSMKNFLRNSIYSVQIFETSNFYLAGIRRHDEKPGVPWSHKQRIKNEIFGKEFLGIEVFPPEQLLVNAANIYWIWVQKYLGENISFNEITDLNKALKK